MKTVAIIGFGRFGKTLYRMIKDDFKIIICRRQTKNLKKIYQADVIFFCVPIDMFEKVIIKHKKYFRDDHLLIDVLSVKQYPQSVLKKQLKGRKTQAILTHPMFGPDSSLHGFNGLTIMINQFLADNKNCRFWKEYFIKKGLIVVEMSAKEHDKLAAVSQGVTHFIGRLLEEFKFKPTVIDTLGAKKLQEVMGQTCKDNRRLFRNLQNFNPYTRQMRIKIGRAYDRLNHQLLLKRINKNHIIYGIQGGKGSFNYQAALSYLKKNQVKHFKIKYLYTSEKVLSSLWQGTLDYGFLAINNNLAGVVDESIRAISRYKSKIIDRFSMEVKHFLMKRKDIDIKKITTIITHPQVIKQCQKTLANRYSNYRLLSGQGDLINTSGAAGALADEKLPKNYAVLGPKELSEIYNLEIIDANFQDDVSFTTFLLVSR